MLFSRWKSHIDIRSPVAERSRNPFDQDPTQDVLTAHLKGPWHRKIPDYLRANNVRGLQLGFRDGFRCNDPACLSELPFITWFSLPHETPDGDFERPQVEQLSGLKHLNAMGRAWQSIDFTAFPDLVSCHLQFQPNLRSIFTAQSLRLLKIYGLKKDAAEHLAALATLENLELAHSGIRNLAPLQGMDHLERLSLNVCRHLENFDNLESLQSLQCLHISEVNCLRDLEKIASLRNLEVLNLTDVGEIASLEPLGALKNLKALWVAGRNTQIVDGDLSVLTELPKLAMLTLVPNRHYSHRAIKKWSWANFENPTTQVERV